MQMKCTITTDRCKASIIIAEDASKPGQRTRWAAVLCGSWVASRDFLLSHGQRGVSFAYKKATGVQRKVFISDGFATAHPLLMDIVKAAANASGSRWKLLTDQNIYLHTKITMLQGRHVREKTVIAFVVPAEKQMQAC